jgi:alpha-L-fucosidase
MVNLLIETRAKGGNLLLNMGPKPDGDVPIEQDDRFRQIGYWMFINGESIYGVRPWVITNEGDYWFTRKAGEDTVYVFARTAWPYATWRDIRLVSVRTTAESKVSVLGQSGEILEYQARVHPETTWNQEADGLHIRAMRAQRTFTNNQDPNPVVLKITHAAAGLDAADLPQVSTGRARWDAATATATLEGNLLSMGKSSELDVWFEYRNIKGFDTNERTDPWIPLPTVRRTAAGVFTSTLKTWKPGDQFEYRAAVKAPLLNMYGQERRFSVP